MISAAFLLDLRNSFMKNSIDEREVVVNDRITLIEKKNGLTFGTDAILLSAFAEPDKTAATLELGSGSGICSLLLASHNKADRIYSVEIQPELHETAIKNIERNNFQNVIKPMLADIRKLNANSFDEPIGTVIANPPYFLFGSGKQSPDKGKNAARFELNGGVSDFCAAASKIMRTQGHFYSVMRAERLCDIVSSLKSAGLEPIKMTFVAHNKNSEPFIVLTEAARISKRSLKITPVLYMRNEDGTPTDDAERIYESCSFGEFLKNE